ncbi:MAG: AbrB/MazE/SpoVT family DNA-binding domain-containing protein [Minisyncoccia bacterium]
MQTVQLKQRGIFTIPKKLRDDLGMFTGQFLRVIKKGNAIIVEPVESFDARLSLDIKESLDDLKKGKYISFSTIDEFDRKMTEKHGSNSH